MKWEKQKKNEYSPTNNTQTIASLNSKCTLLTMQPNANEQLDESELYKTLSCMNILVTSVAVTGFVAGF